MAFLNDVVFEGRVGDSQGEPVEMRVTISHREMVRCDSPIRDYVSFRIISHIERELVGNLGAVTWPG